MTGQSIPKDTAPAQRPQPFAALPHRGRWGAPRPAALAALPLPPAAMPLQRGGRPRKRWRYVGVFGPELMACAALVQVGVARQSFWAVWERPGGDGAGRLLERTRFRRGGVRLAPGRLEVDDVAADGTPVALALALAEVDGVETVCRHGRQYAWTRKQGGVAARGRVRVGGRERVVDAHAVIDDSAGYHARRTAWRWCAGVGRAQDGRAVAWNLVAGINDPPRASERTVWVDGAPAEAAPATFAADLGRVTTADGGDLCFAAEAVRERREHLLLVRSAYRQPFGTFAGTLPGGIPLAAGWGVMEAHDARW